MMACVDTQTQGITLYMNPTTVKMRTVNQLRSAEASMWATQAAIAITAADRRGELKGMIDMWLSWEEGKEVAKDAHTLMSMMLHGVEGVRRASLFDTIRGVLDGMEVEEWPGSPGEMAEIMVNAAGEFDGWAMHGLTGEEQEGAEARAGRAALRAILDEGSERREESR